MAKKILSYLSEAVTHASAPEMCTFTLSIIAYCVCGNAEHHLYLWLIILLCELLVVGAHGAWIVGAPLHHS